MIIVSQDKNIVVNFDNVANINIEKCYNESTKEDDSTFDILVFIVSSGLVRIGQYKIEERAKEVLQEIIKVYKFYNGKTYYVEDEKKLLGKYEYGVYEMPVEKVDDK